MEIVTIVTALIAAVAALTAAGLGAWQAYRVALLGVRAQTRSANRKAWMNQIVRVVTDLIATARHKPDEVAVLTRLATELNLLLYPEEVAGKPGPVVDACAAIKLTLQKLRGLRTADDWRAFSDRLTEGFVGPLKTVLAYEWTLVMEQR